MVKVMDDSTLEQMLTSSNPGARLKGRLTAAGFDDAFWSWVKAEHDRNSERSEVIVSFIESAVWLGITWTAMQCNNRPEMLEQGLKVLYESFGDIAKNLATDDDLVAGLKKTLKRASSDDS